MFTIKLDDREIAEFVNTASKLKDDINVSCDNVVVSGKSIMGMSLIQPKGKLLVHFPNGISAEDQNIAYEIFSKWAYLEPRGVLNE